MNHLLSDIWTGLTQASWLDQVNLVLGIVGVWLMIRRNLWAFPVGLVAVTVQGVLFFRTRFYADATLQVFFLVTLAWGWWHWVKARGAAPELPVSRLTPRALSVTLLVTTFATVVWAFALASWTDAVMPLRDAFIAAFSVTAQVLQARKKLENWPLWLAANGVAIVSYWYADLGYTAFLYAIYFVLAVTGWKQWARANTA
ncbi:MAG: nicotinamide riboside transporter PnuC [Opitutus sp.]